MKQSLYNVSSYTQGLKWDLAHKIWCSKAAARNKNFNNNCNACELYMSFLDCLPTVFSIKVEFL